MKNHEIRELVNTLRDIAMKYHATQQLREQIAGVVVPAIELARRSIPPGEETAKAAAQGDELPPLPEKRIREIIASLFADQTVTDEDILIARAVEKEVGASCRAGEKAGEGDRVLELIKNPPWGRPDLYARLHSFMKGELELAKQQNKVREWFNAARSLLEFFGGGDGGEKADARDALIEIAVMNHAPSMRDRPSQALEAIDAALSAQKGGEEE